MMGSEEPKDTQRRFIRLCVIIAAILVVLGLAAVPLTSLVKAQINGKPKPTASTEKLTNAIRMEFVVIPPGRFVMGSDRWMDDQKPPHEVQITKGFQMGKYEVTQAQWEAVMGNNPSEFKGPNKPVDSVSWDDAEKFLQKLNEMNDGYLYRLPTEAEWEYAARAGTVTDYDSDLDTFWDGQNSGGETHPVGQKKPNAWGLYDMLGNVWEWCQDWYDPHYYAKSPIADPQGPPSGMPITKKEGLLVPSKQTVRVLRGGSFESSPFYVFVTTRVQPAADVYRSPHGIGFRCVREKKTP
jgi:formylglycine-generating enzyme required for sulfatase activity